MSLLDSLIGPGERIDDQLQEHDERLDEHDARLTHVESESPGVEPPGADPVVVPVSGLCDPASGNVIEAIHDHYRARDPNDRNHHYVLDAREWVAETGCDEVYGQDAAERFREEHGRDPVWFDSHRYFGVSGEGLVDIDVQSPDVDLLFSIGRREGGVPNAQRTVLENVRVDVSGDVDCGIAAVHTYIRGRIEDIELRGTRNRQHDEFGGAKYGLKVDAIHPRGQNEIRNVKQTSGDTRASDAEDIFPHAIPFSSERFHVGRNHWMNCSAHDWWNNGFYLKGGPGQNVIERSTAKNCAGAHIRLGTNDVARDCQIEMGGRTDLCGPGIWLNEGEPLVENCTITVGGTWNADALRINSDAAGGTVRDSKIINDADCRTVAISEQGTGVDKRPTRLINLDIDHAGRSGGYAVENFRPGLEIVGGHWRGGSAREKRHLLVSDPRVRVSKTTFQTDGAAVNVRGAESTFSDVEVRGGELYVTRDGPDGLRFDGRCSDVEINAPDEVVDLIRGTGGVSPGGNW